MGVMIWMPKEHGPVGVVYLKCSGSSILSVRPDSPRFTQVHPLRGGKGFEVQSPIHWLSVSITRLWGSMTIHLSLI